MDWSVWVEDNYKYILMGLSKSCEDRKNVMALDDLCKKHNVSLKVFMDIFSEFNEVIKND